jgi:hypothetical protein
MTACSVSIIDSKIIGNQASHSGAGIYSESNTISNVRVHNSTIRDNVAKKDGGGVFSYGYSVSAISVSNSKILNNKTTNSFSVFGGAGLLTLVGDDSGHVNVQNSIIAGNSTFGGGGAIHIQNSTYASLVINNSTVHNNTGDLYGGGVFFTSGTTSIHINNSTFTKNVSSGAGGGINIYSFDSSRFVLHNSTFYDNIASNSTGVLARVKDPNRSTDFECKGSVICGRGSQRSFTNDAPIKSGGFNLFGNHVDGFKNTDSINVSFSSLNLLPLNENGGFTPTCMPGPGSIAINSGDPSDSSAAQNRSPLERRDRGSTEAFCSVSIRDSVSACQRFTWKNGNTYTANTSNVYHTKYSTVWGVCDSVFSLDLKISPLPDASVKHNGNTITANTSGASYQWIDCDSKANLFGENNQSLTTSKNGTYAVVVDDGNCIDTSRCVTIRNSNNGGNVSVESNQLELPSVVLYPNPSNGRFYVTTPQYIETNIEIYTSTGSIISVYDNCEPVQPIQLDVPVGIYFVRVSGQDYNDVFRLVIE